MIWNAEEFRAPELLPFAKTGQKFMRATAALQAHSVRALLRCQIEGASFLKRRFEDDLKLLDKLTGGDEFVDAFDVFANFVQNATSDYANEVGKFASIGAKFASETAGRVRKEAETTVDDMAAATLAT
ncbi:phasin family protein [Mesorhizobium sp. WSM4904]|uniref:phasin family protein n=1 Tax=Mesorhizobium sp. WSM4904 TaxID=3038545 RepID=UPI0024188F7E|nr:phasin family protein [Mesorhizobium sp. WSM4904]WFP62267.1 phasin family protein [Mesorhizobium sp. WSM4904]